MMKHSMRYTWLKVLSYLLAILIIIGLNSSLWAEEGTTCTVVTNGKFLQYTNVIYSPDCYTGNKMIQAVYIDDDGFLVQAIGFATDFLPTPVTASLALGSVVKYKNMAAGVNDPADCQQARYTADKMRPMSSTGYCFRKLLDSGEDFYLYVYIDNFGIPASGSFFTAPSDDISGNWTTEDYTCKGQPSSVQKVKITEIDDVFTAIKLTGDNCMPTGYSTFHWDSKKNSCRLIELTNPGDLSTQSMNFTACILERTDKDHFKIILPNRDNDTLSFQKEGINSLPWGGFDLVGTWSSEYECNGQRSMIQLDIERNDAVLTAVRQDGDNCLPVGYMQFYLDLDSGICQWVSADTDGTFDLYATFSTLYSCDVNLNKAAGQFRLFFPNNKERKEMVFRKIAGISTNPTKVSENLSIQIPYAEYQLSPTQTRTIQGNLELVPTTDGELLWKMSNADFLD